MKVVAIIQARMGSSRLPGKMMLSLGGKETITRVIERTAKAETVDEIVVATPETKADSLLVDRAIEAEASIYQGSEQDVLQRMVDAALEVDAEIIIRIAGDCPAVSPIIIDHAVETTKRTNADYVSNKLTRTFPLGLDVEVFTKDSFIEVERLSSKPKEREHVTVYYRENDDEFNLQNFTSDEVFAQSKYINRDDIELVLDEAQDYIYLDTIFSDLPKGNQSIHSIVDYIDDHDMPGELKNVSRKTKDDTEINTEEQG